MKMELSKRYCKFPDFFIVTNDEVRIPVSKEKICEHFGTFEKFLVDDNFNLNEYKDNADSKCIIAMLDHVFLDNKIEQHDNPDLYKEAMLLYFKWEGKLLCKYFISAPYEWPGVHEDIPPQEYIGEDAIINILRWGGCHYNLTLTKKAEKYVGMLLYKIYKQGRLKYEIPYNQRDNNYDR